MGYRFGDETKRQEEKLKAYYLNGGRKAIGIDVASPNVMVVSSGDDHIPTGTAIDPDVTFDDFVGQDRAKELVLLNIQAWERDPDNVPGHMLFTGPGGVGKSTIANAVANRMGTKFITTAPHHLRAPAQIFEFFFNPDFSPKIQQGDIIFIDEVHGFDMRMAAFMYNVLQDFVLDYKLNQPLIYDGDRYSSGDVVRLKIPKFLCVGATTDAGMMHPPLRDRFINRMEFDLYSPEEIAEIVSRYRVMGSLAAMEIAKRSAGNPRKAKALTRLSHLVSNRMGRDTVYPEDVLAACDLFGIDEKGLDKNAQRVVEFFVKTGNKPAGTPPIAASTGIYRTTLEGETFKAMAYAGVLVFTSRGKHLSPEYYQEVVNGK